MGGLHNQVPVTNSLPESRVFEVVPLKTRHAEEVNVRLLCQGSMFFRWCGAVVKKWGASPGVILDTRSSFKITRSVVNSPL
ncbi:hypothetical protein TNCV_3643221 [Trichonephila clavipes]|nr:hypothetical protein TNCV_3643221 [Trichonephila clavipes]